LLAVNPPSLPRVGNERNLVHLVEKSVEIKLKSCEIKRDFLEIKLRNQPNPPTPPTFTTYDVIFEGNHMEIKLKSGNLVRQNCSLPTPRVGASPQGCSIGRRAPASIELGFLSKLLLAHVRLPASMYSAHHGIFK